MNKSVLSKLAFEKFENVLYKKGRGGIIAPGMNCYFTDDLKDAIDEVVDLVLDEQRRWK